VLAVILFNPIAGAGRAAHAALVVEEALRAAGHETHRIESVLGPVGEWLTQHLRGAGVLIVVGGDGAVRLAAPAAIEAAVPIRHVPMGTENLFARECGAGRDPQSVVQSLARARVERFDVGRIGSERFVIMLSAGFDAEVVHDLAARRTGAISHLSYASPILRRLLSWRAPRMSVVMDDGSALVRDEPGVLFVANSRQYALRFDPAARADPSDGQLDVLFLPARTAAGVLRWMIRCRLRRQFSARGARHAKTAALSFWGDPPVRLQVDGDPLLVEPASKQKPAEITVEPAALPVFMG